ncbi:MAG: ATP-dependent zinc protease [Halioglobus sp.]
MTSPQIRCRLLAILVLALSAGCTNVPVAESTADTRLDKLVSNMDQSLANQAAFNTQLREQQQQLQLQAEQLESLSQHVGKPPPPAAAACPKPVACPPLAAAGKMVVGALENVWLPDLELALTARIDTGAELSSLDASNIELFERDGKNWVRFEITNPANGKPQTLERRLHRTVGIRQSGSKEARRRPVIKLTIVIGKSEQTAEFTLSDRSHQTYQALIGRNVLKDVMVVDVGRKNVAPYSVPKKPADKKGSAG